MWGSNESCKTNANQVMIPFYSTHIHTPFYLSRATFFSLFKFQSVQFVQKSQFSDAGNRSLWGENWHRRAHTKAMKCFRSDRYQNIKWRGRVENNVQMTFSGQRKLCTFQLSIALSTNSIAGENGKIFLLKHLSQSELLAFHIKRRIKGNTHMRRVSGIKIIFHVIWTMKAKNESHQF